MGFPISRFSLFYGLYNQTQQSEEVHRIFSRFNLIAIILHNPADKKFQQKMENHFEYYDSMTGPNFLFITFIKRNRWIEATRNERKYLKTLTLGEGKTDDFELQHLKQLFKVEEKENPVIILTTDLNSKTYAVIDTSTEIIEKQLREIGKFCRYQEKPQSCQDPNFKRLVRDLQECKSYNWENYSDEISSFPLPLRYSLIATFSRIQKRNIESSKDYLQELPNIIQFNRQLMDLIVALLQEIKIRDILIEKLIRRIYLKEQTEEQCDELLSLLQERELFQKSTDIWFQELANAKIICLPQQEVDRKYLINDISDEWEQDSQIYAKTHNELCRALLHNGNRENNNDEFDFACLSFYMPKIWENEINRSIVQKMRQLIGIEMPDYWFQYKQCDENFHIECGNKQVDLNNRYGRNNWKAPTIGDSKYAYDTLISKQLMDPIGNNDLFSKLWGKLNNARNRTTHWEPIDMDTFMRTYGYFNQLKDQFFPTLMAIKREMRGY